MPEISVVVPIYNVEEYLPACIDSILAQTFSEFELILVNDGSKDGSLDICKQYAQKDARIRIIDKINGGLSDARNAGMDVATGTYISFIDSDDSVEPTLLEKCLQKMKETEADLVIFDVYQYYQKTNTKEVIRNVYSEDHTYNLESNPEMLTKILNAAWNKFYKLNLFKENHIQYPWGCYYEDLGTTYRLLARCKKIAFVNEPLYDYLKDRPGNITNQFNFAVYHVLDMLKLTIEDYQKLGIYERYYEELKYLSGVNILECLKKTRTVNDKAMTDKFIQVCFWFLHNHFPEFPKCKYPILREKNDWIYANPFLLRMYLSYRRSRMKGEVH